MHTAFSHVHSVPAKKTALGSVIWLHGLGDTLCIEPLLPLLHSQLGDHINLLFPKATSRQLEVYGGRSMPAWYDISNSADALEQKNHSVMETLSAIEELIESEIESGIPSENIVIMGFSQGGAIALQLAFASKYPLAGVASLSGYMIENIGCNRDEARKLRCKSVFIGHGLNDTRIPFALCERVLNVLTELGHKPKLKVGQYTHRIDQVTFSELGHWLQSILKPSLQSHALVF